MDPERNCQRDVSSVPELTWEMEDAGAFVSIVDERISARSGLTVSNADVIVCCVALYAVPCIWLQTCIGTS